MKHEKPKEYIMCPECRGYAGYDCECRDGNCYKCEECNATTCVPFFKDGDPEREGG